MRILQLNVQRDKHYHRIFPYLDQERFDAICLQEIMEPDIAILRERYGCQIFFEPRVLRDGIAEGLAILSPHPLQNTKAVRYAGGTVIEEGPLQGTPEEKAAKQIYYVIFADIVIGSDRFRIATTHFPWTANGEVSEYQRETMPEMLRVLKAHEEFVFCGDFNAPRPNEIWNTLASEYKDNIPPEFTYSLDPELHRAPKEEREKMVDGIFTSPGYVVGNVERVCGLSDHCGFTAEISVV